MILLALIGFGEVGQTFARGLVGNTGVRVAAYDYPGIEWPKAIARAGERVAKHGVRRAEEMREAGAMLEDLGLDPGLCRAIAAVQERGAKP